MNVFRLDFHNQRKSLLVWASIVAVSVLSFMAFYPSMNSTDMAAAITSQASAFSPEMLQAFGLDSLPDFTRIIEFYAYLMQYFALAGACYGAILGANALIGEETSGTIEYLYAQPVTRTEIFFQKLLSAVTSYSLYCLAVALLSYLSILLFKAAGTDLSNAFGGITKITAGLLFTGLIFLTVGFLLSVLIKSQKSVAFLATGLVFGTYIAGSFALAFDQKIDGIRYLIYLSPLHYAVPADILKTGVEPSYIWTGLGLMLVSVGLAYILYQKKDLKS